jgi:transcription antitermination factor NusG
MNFIKTIANMENNNTNKRREDSLMRVSYMLRDIQLRGVANTRCNKEYNIGWATLKACIELGYLEKLNKKLFPKYQYVTYIMTEKILNKANDIQREYKRLRDNKNSPISKQIKISSEKEPIKIIEYSLESLSDSKLVDELRLRGYTVTASKIIEL